MKNKDKTIEEKVKYYLSLPYTIQIVPYKEGGFFVSVKELEGCMTEADTLEEAYNMIKDAMAAWLEVAIEEGEKVPLPQVLEEEKYSGRILLRLPKSLHRKLIENAKEEGVSLNQYIVYLISERNKENKLLNQILSHIRGEFANVGMDELNVEADYLIGRYKVSFPKKIFKKPELKWSH